MHLLDLGDILKRETYVTAAKPGVRDLPSDRLAPDVLDRDAKQGRHLGAGHP
jgi:hypothetical protein